MQTPKSPEIKDDDGSTISAILFLLVCCAIVIGTWEMCKWGVAEFNKSYELTFIIEKVGRGR